MNLVDARLINTRHGLETYLDLIENIEIKAIHFPASDNGFYEIMLGIKYFLLAEKKYYENQKHYFGIEMSDDYSSIKLKEPDTESLFAVKDESERQATKDLVADWLIKTKAFKQVINGMIEKQQTESIQSEEDIKRVLGTVKFLGKLLQLKTEDIQHASIEKYNN